MIALDTNILIYAAQAAPDHRKARAIEVIAAAALVDSILPVQALAEFCAACRKKGLLEFASCEARVAEWSSGFQTVSATPIDVAVALAAAKRNQMSFYDALLCATARRNGATTLLTEDMADGATYDGLRVLNPFAPGNQIVIDRLLVA